MGNESLRVTETITGELSPSKRVEKRLQLNFPSEIMAANPQVAEVAEAISGVKIIEYDSGKPGDLVLVTNGVHGEETREEQYAVVSLIDDDFAGPEVEVKSGCVVLIPNINAPGFAAKTRYVFPDESHTNLNNVFDRYQTGEWDEFWQLSSKTEMYAWLLMKYFTGKRDEHQRKYGIERNAYLIDDHAEEIAVPHIRIDRMYEDQAVLEQLLSAIDEMEIPAVLEYPDWAIFRFAESLSATATAQSIMSVTIEEGRTVEPDILMRMYIQSQLLLFMKRLGMIDISPKILPAYSDKFNYQYLPVALKMTKEIWGFLHDSSTLFCLDDILPAIFNRDGEKLKPKDLVLSALDKKSWDGSIKVQYTAGLRGKQGGKRIPIGNLYFNESNQPDVYLALVDFPDTSWVISAPEPLNSSGIAQEARSINYGFFLIEGGGKKTVKLDIADQTEEKPLHPDELRKHLKVEDTEVDLSMLELTCIVPDQIWEKRRDDNKVFLLNKNSTADDR